VRVENEKFHHFKNLAHGPKQQTRKLQIYARILQLRQELMKRHAISVFCPVFFNYAGLCQITQVYAAAGTSFLLI
jgi:hypothetical protein